MDGWQQSAVGVYRQAGVAEDWPVHAEDRGELREVLTTRGHLLPLPTEPATLANLVEIWRSTARDWKRSPEAEKLLRRALEDV